MSDMDDLIAHLTAQAGMQQNGPSLFGLQAQQDPNNIMAVLSKIKQQQVLSDNNAPTPGQYGYLHDAGKAAFNSVGSMLGGGLAALGNGPQQVSPQVAAQNAALMQGKQDLSAGLAQPGADPRQVQIDVLTKLAQAGVPNAADALEKASDALEKTKVSNSQIDKNSSQAAAARDEINARAAAQKHAQFEEGGQTWHYVSTNDGIAQYVNDHGEPKVVTIQPSKTIAAAAPAGGLLSPGAIDALVDQKLTTGKDPPGAARAGIAVPYYNALAARLAATGDTVGSANAQAAGYKAAGQALDVNTKMLAQTQSAGAQIEKNIANLQPIVAKLGGAGSPLLQKALNNWNQGVVGDKDTAQAVFYINELQNELARISSGSFGNTPLSDSAKADAKDLINKTMISTGSLDGVFLASRQSYANKLDSLREARSGLTSTLGQNAKGSPFGGKGGSAPPPPQDAPPAPPATNTVSFGDLK